MEERDKAVAESHLELEERIRKRAHEIWLAHRESDNRSALDDWLEAEQEVLGSAKQPAQDRGTTVGDAHRPKRLV